MNKSTPTTGEIQQNYIWGISSEIEKRNQNFSMAIGRFDRWLRKFRSTERLKERERIIKLLTEAAIQHDIETAPWSGSSLWRAIALIKGENK